RRTIGQLGQLACASFDGGFELARWIDGIHEPPFDRPAALYSFHQRAEEVGAVAAYVSFVDEPRQSARSGQHAEKRRFGKTDGGVPIVDEDDLVAGQRKLVAAAGANAVQRREKPNPGMS